MPSISPAFTVRLIFFNLCTPKSSIILRFCTSSTGFVGFAGVLSTRSRTFLPTISSAKSSGLVSSVFKVAVISPWRITLTVSVISIISLSLWVIKIMVLPSSLSRLSILKSWSASAGVRTPVGSSKIKIFACR